MSNRKFGKQIQKRQLEVPEYAASFVNYKALKKVCSIPGSTTRLPQHSPSLVSLQILAVKRPWLLTIENTKPLQLIKKLSATPLLQAQGDPLQTAAPVDQQAALQANKATFFFQLVG